MARIRACEFHETGQCCPRTSLVPPRRRWKLALNCPDRWSRCCGCRCCCCCCRPPLLLLPPLLPPLPEPLPRFAWISSLDHCKPFLSPVRRALRLSRTSCCICRSDIDSMQLICLFMLDISVWMPRGRSGKEEEDAPLPWLGTKLVHLCSQIPVLMIRDLREHSEMRTCSPQVCRVAAHAAQL